MKTLKRLLTTLNYTLHRLYYKRYLKTYSSIDDIPIWNWFQIKDTGNIKYIYKVKDYSKDLFIFEYTHLAYDALLEQYTTEFVLKKEAHQKIKAERNVAIAFLEAIVSGDKVSFLMAKQLEAELESENTGEGENSLTKIIAILEAHRSMNFDPKTMSVSKFYTHINLLIESGKKTDTKQRTNPDGGI